MYQSADIAIPAPIASNPAGKTRSDLVWGWSSVTGFVLPVNFGRLASITLAEINSRLNFL